jgi:triphosphatase
VPSPGPAPSDVEVEWQFDALDLRPVERWLDSLSAPRGGATTNRPDEPAAAVNAQPLAARRLVDGYLDTADWRVKRSGFVLRVRRRAGGAEVTLKDSSPATAGLRRRLEVTEPLPAGGMDALGSDGPVGRRLHALVGNRPLHQVLEVRTRRRPFAVRLGGSEIAEVALDDTVISVTDGARPVRLRRVEVETAPESVDRLAPLVARLQTECGLQPATLSKFEAGLLASGLHISKLPDVGPVALGGAPSVGELAFVVLRRNLLAMLAHEPGTRLGEDPEELHDMRVATRRLRAALSMFADALPARARHLRDELGWLADALGAVRDLDVQLEGVAQWETEVPDAERVALGELDCLLRHRRDVARRRLLSCLESSRYDRLVSSFTAMLRQGPSRRSAPGRAPAVAVVPELVRARHGSVTKTARRARRSGSVDDFHRLRIRAKRLRYALEFASELYDGRTAKYVRGLVRLQDALGLMQDARVAAERLHTMVVEEGEGLSTLTVFAMGTIAQRYRHEAAALAQRVPKQMDAVSGLGWRRMIEYMDRRRLEATVWTTPISTRSTPTERPEGSEANEGADRVRAPFTRA